ncbi:hypothetical protein EVAR_51557_1 [Eumeta japonica]|uniref:Uncharacterized protein n=1 Tax=Eumeta variegata TaxID=151549 RepID=A0A4C1YHS9_EUMVA|nr:hypothetical protein EVAR_51557_1 [Eumeta japonica]
MAVSGRQCALELHGEAEVPQSVIKRLWDGTPVSTYNARQAHSINASNIKGSFIDSGRCWRKTDKACWNKKLQIFRNLETVKETTIKGQAVNTAHKHLQPQSNHQCVAGLLDRDRISDGQVSGLLEVGVGHQNSHSSDEMQQRNLHVCALNCKSTAGHKPPPLVFHYVYPGSPVTDGDATLTKSSSRPKETVRSPNRGRPSTAFFSSGRRSYERLTHRSADLLR